MSSVSRFFAQRSSVLRALARRQAMPARSAYISPAARRGYASAHGAVEKSSDMPWLLSSVGVTVVGLAYLLSAGPEKSGAHGPKSATAHHEEKADKGHKHKPDEQPPQDEAPASDSSESEAPKSEPAEGAADASAPGKASESGQNVPPPPADSADLATKSDEKKQGHEELKETTRAGETKAATSSSTTPSKKTAAEDPREDPQKGEGEAVQKGSAKN